MLVKENPKKEVKCPCGKNTVVDVKAATAYCELTRFKCDCGRVYHIIDYMNGCTCYYEASKEVDKNYLEQVKAERDKKMQELKNTTFPPAQVQSVLYRMTRNLPFDFSIDDEDYDLEIVLTYDNCDDENDLVTVKVDDVKIDAPSKFDENTYEDIGEKIHSVIVDWFSNNVTVSDDALKAAEAIFEVVWETMQGMGLV